MRSLFISLFLLCVCIAVTPATAASPKFPELTGRVVDNAHVLSPRTLQYLSGALADYEAGTTNQIVVVTLPWLLNDTIENYSNLLFRHWQLGQKGKDNGVLLLLVTSEKHVHIEVGYRLEPVLTDAVSSEIINGIIVPALKDVDYDRAVTGGVQAIIGTLGGHSVSTGYHQSVEQQSSSPLRHVLAVIFLIFFLFLAARHPFLAMWLLSNARFGSSGGGSYGGSDNFRGGGGSAGGGGASGSW